MQIKYYCMRLEFKLKQKFSELSKLDIYYSKRRKYVHFGFEKPLNHYERKEEILKEIEDFYNLNLKKDFKILKPIKLINIIRWKSDYIVFRKR